jgi:hypothetical protein
MAKERSTGRESLITRKDIIIIVLLVLTIFLFATETRCGVNVDKAESFLDKALSGELPYINENTTLEEAARLYYSYKPVSTGLMKSYLNKMCEEK